MVKGAQDSDISLGPEKEGLIVGVFSIKGGVGKTTTVANLSKALSNEFNDNVVAVDCNLTAPNLGLHFGVSEPDFTIHDFLNDDIPIDDVITPLEGGPHLISGSLGFDDEIHSIDLSDLAQELKERYKFIFLDTAPGLGAEVLAAMKVCDAMLVVTTPKIPEVASTLKTFKAAEKRGGRIIGVEINMRKGGEFEIPLSSMKKSFAWTIISTIPYDDKVDESTAACVPIVKYDPDSDIADAFREAASGLLEKLKEIK